MLKNENTVFSPEEVQSIAVKMYEMAKDEIVLLDKQRDRIIARIRYLERLLNVQKSALANDSLTKRVQRVKTPQLMRDIQAVLENCDSQSLSGSSILNSLITEYGYPDTRSFRTRVYGSLSRFSKSESYVKRSKRGTYTLAGDGK